MATYECTSGGDYIYSFTTTTSGTTTTVVIYRIPVGPKEGPRWGLCHAHAPADPAAACRNYCASIDSSRPSLAGARVVGAPFGDHPVGRRGFGEFVLDSKREGSVLSVSKSHRQIASVEFLTAGTCCSDSFVRFAGAAQGLGGSTN